MISISRSTLRDFRTVCRKTFGPSRAKELWIHIQAAAGQLTLRTANFEAAVELKLPSEAEFSGYAQYELLDACQAANTESVTFHALPTRGVRAEWQDRGVPWQREGSKPAKHVPEFPTLPTELATNEPGFLAAYAAACGCTSGESGRYALGCVQMAGELGRMAATDGHQLLVQDGFRFPWEGAVLVPANKGLSAWELFGNVPVQVGKIKTQIAFVAGNWTIWLREFEGKFPRVTETLRGQQASQSHCEIDPADATCAVDALPRLPALADLHQPVVMELNGEARLCARPQDGSPAVALQLVRSQCVGPAVTISTDRQYLARALALGFTRFGFDGAEATIQAYAPNKQYCWLPLTPAPTPTNRPVHVISSLTGLTGKGHGKVSKPVATATAQVPSVPNTVAATANVPDAAGPRPKAIKRKRRAEMAVSSGSPSEPSPLDVALELRQAFRESLAKVNTLLGVIKRQRRQSKLVASTLQSLRSLQAAG
jgi:hypothetical protein